MVCGWVGPSNKQKGSMPALRRGSAKVGTESPAHHTPMQYAPQNPVLPVEEGSTGQLPELSHSARRGWLPNAPSTLMCTVVRQLQKLGVTLAYRFDGQSMQSRNPTHEELMWILLYALDISLACDNIDHLRTAVSLMDSTFLQWGLTIKKPKVLGRDAEAKCLMQTSP